MLTREQARTSDGPWIWQCNRWDNGTYSGTTTYVVIEGHICKVWGRDMHQEYVQDNSNFMSHARNDIPALLAHIRELEAEKARLLSDMSKIFTILYEAPEINMQNYYEDQIIELNSSLIEAFNICYAVLGAIKESPCQK